MPFLKRSESTKKEQLIFTVATIKVEVQLKNACMHMRCGHVRNLKLQKFFLHVFIHLYENLHQQKFPAIWYCEPQFAQATCAISTLCALLCNLKTGTLLYSGFQNYIANCTNLKYVQKRHRKRLTGKQYWEGHISTHLESQFKFEISTNIMLCWTQT